MGRWYKKNRARHPLAKERYESRKQLVLSCFDMFHAYAELRGLLRWAGGVAIPDPDISTRQLWGEFLAFLGVEHTPSDLTSYEARYWQIHRDREVLLRRRQAMTNNPLRVLDDLVDKPLTPLTPEKLAELRARGEKAVIMYEHDAALRDQWTFVAFNLLWQDMLDQQRPPGAGIVRRAQAASMRLKSLGKCLAAAALEEQRVQMAVRRIEERLNK